MKAQKMFEELGFRKNMSVCYNEQHIRYEKIIDKDYFDIFSIEFKEGYFVYTSLHRTPIHTYGKVLKAIYQQMKELGWLDSEV